MLFKTIVLVCATLASSHAKNIAPYGIVDEIQKQLDELHNIVEGDIMVAHDELRQLRYDFLDYSGRTSASGIILIQQRAQTVYAQLNTLRQLGNSAGVDVTPCFGDNEIRLQEVGSYSIGNLTQCVGAIDREARRLLDRATYVVDIAVNTVHRLQDQFNRCAGATSCLAPLVNEILLEEIRLPQNIKTEVDSADITLNSLRPSVDYCVEEREVQYTQQSSLILTSIAYCVDRIIS